VIYRVSPDPNPTFAPPNTTFALTGVPSTLTAGQPVTATESFTDNGELPAQHVRLGLRVPAGWSVTATSPTSFGAVETGQTVQATFEVTEAPPLSPSGSDTVTGTANYTWPGKTPQSATWSQQVTA
jgi:hypothetical protein